jgi:hypothetical protein
VAGLRDLRSHDGWLRGEIPGKRFLGVSALLFAGSAAVTIVWRGHVGELDIGCPATVGLGDQSHVMAVGFRSRTVSSAGIYARAVVASS